MTSQEDARRVRAGGANDGPGAVEDPLVRIKREERENYGDRVVRQALPEGVTEVRIHETPARVAARLVAHLAALLVRGAAAALLVVSGGLLVRVSSDDLVTWLGTGITVLGGTVLLTCTSSAKAVGTLAWRGTSHTFQAAADAAGLVLGVDVEGPGAAERVRAPWPRVQQLVRYRLVDKPAGSDASFRHQTDYLLVVLRDGRRLRVPACGPDDRWKRLMAIAHEHGGVAVRGLGWPAYEYRDTDPFRF